MPNPTSKLNLVINGATTQLDIHDSNAVDLTSNQTVGGDKEFTGTTTAHDVIPSATETYNFGSPSYQWNNAYIKSLTINGDLVGSGALSLKSKSGTSRIYLRNNNASAYPSSVNLYSKVGDNPEYGVYLNGQSFHPNITDAMNLGTANLKWKSFNGINPGALSLPGNYVNVDTTNWVLDGSNVNIFTPTSDGWLGIQATDTVYDQMHYIFVGRNDSVSYHSQNILSPVSGLWLRSYHGCVFIPVIKNVRYDIRCICNSIVATFYPCQGNV